MGHFWYQFGVTFGHHFGSLFGSLLVPIWGHFLGRFWGSFWVTFWATFWITFEASLSAQRCPSKRIEKVRVCPLNFQGAPKCPVVFIYALPPHLHTEAQACTGTALKAQGVRATSPNQPQEALQASAVLSPSNFFEKGVCF